MPLGTIHCRFVQGSQHIRELGAYLQRCQVGNHSSYFIIQEKYLEDQAQQFLIPQDVIDNMMDSGSFLMELKFTTSGRLLHTDVLLCLDRRDICYSISGFPRLLQDEGNSRGATYLYRAVFDGKLLILEQSHPNEAVYQIGCGLHHRFIVVESGPVLNCLISVTEMTTPFPTIRTQTTLLATQLQLRPTNFQCSTGNRTWNMIPVVKFTSWLPDHLKSTRRT